MGIWISLLLRDFGVSSKYSSVQLLLKTNRNLNPLPHIVQLPGIVGLADVTLCRLAALSTGCIHAKFKSDDVLVKLLMSMRRLGPYVSPFALRCGVFVSKCDIQESTKIN